jgi:hypothetical protein
MRRNPLLVALMVAGSPVLLSAAATAEDGGAAVAGDLGVSSQYPAPSSWLVDYQNRPALSLLSSPPRAEARLTGLAGSILGITPLSIPGNLRGTYRLSVAKPGYAFQRVRLDFAGKSSELSPGQPVAAMPSPLLSTLLPPGSLEIQQGMGLRGVSYLVGEIAAITGTAWSHRRANSLSEDSEALAEAAAAAGGELATGLANESIRTAQRADAYRRARTQWLLLGAGLWTVNALERTVMSGSSVPAVDGRGNLKVSLRPLTRTGVALRSAILPGWGQAYAGRGGAASGFLTSGLTLLSGFLLADQAYDRAESEFKHAERELDLARQAGEEEYAQALSALQHADEVADDAWRVRSIALAGTAALWAYNFFDAVYSGGGPAGREPGTQVSALSPADGRLGVRVRF